jgi:hypothetical protein
MTGLQVHIGKEILTGINNLLFLVFSMIFLLLCKVYLIFLGRLACGSLNTFWVWGLLAPLDYRLRLQGSWYILNGRSV